MISPNSAMTTPATFLRIKDGNLGLDLHFGGPLPLHEHEPMLIRKIARILGGADHLANLHPSHLVAHVTVAAILACAPRSIRGVNLCLRFASHPQEWTGLIEGDPSEDVRTELTLRLKSKLLHFSSHVFGSESRRGFAIKESVEDPDARFRASAWGDEGPRMEQTEGLQALRGTLMRAVIEDWECFLEDIQLPALPHNRPEDGNLVLDLTGLPLDASDYSVAFENFFRTLHPSDFVVEEEGEIEDL